MKARPQEPLSNRMRKTLEEEVDKAFQQKLNQYNREANVQIMFVLHFVFGYGDSRLRKFFKELTKQQEELTKWYEMGYADLEFICETKLKEDHVDVESILCDSGKDRNN